MSITNLHGLFLLTCDICGEEHPDVFSSFEEAVEAEKDDGWKTQKYDGEWEDVCPECQENEINEDFEG
jgi:hypothetical protein